MRLHTFIGSSLALCLVPMFCSAEQVLEWDFTGRNMPAGWKLVGDAEVIPQRDGILITARTDVMVGTVLEGHRGLDTVSLQYRTAENLVTKLVWRLNIGGENIRAKAELILRPSAEISTSEINMSKYINWDRKPTYLGLEIPAGRRVLLKKVEARGYNILEKSIEVLQSYWQLDQIRPSAINFLWGPQLTTNPIATKQMYIITPPRARSGNWLSYGAIGIAIAVAAWRLRKGRMYRHQATTLVAGVVLACWLVFDLRMGLEYLRYAKDDYQEYWSQPVGRRTFRERLYFNDFAESVSGFLQNERAYVFAGHERWPFLGMMRYYTYPTVPTEPNDVAEDVDTWVFYRRPDFSVNQAGQLEHRGNAITEPGTVLHEYEAGSFIFRTNP